MKTFTRQFHARPQGFRGHDFSVNEKTMTLPDAVPTLKEIILSGSMQQVGTPLYDSSYEEGAYRAVLQSLPLEQVLNGRDGANEDADERSEKKDEKAQETAGKPAPGDGKAEPEQEVTE